jgi:hypothetical protein
MGTVPYGFESPTSPSPQPHWKTAVSTPNEAPTASRLQRIALRGTSSERNATRRMRKLNASTVPMTSGKRAAMSAARSSNAAVTPPT